MSTHLEWVSTANPFFAVEKSTEGYVRGEYGEDFEEDDPTNDNPVIVISGNEMMIIEGNLHEFATRVVRAVYGGSARIAFDLHADSSDPAQ